MQKYFLSLYCTYRGNNLCFSGSFCDKKDEEDLIPTLQSNFLFEIKKILEPVVAKADRLAFNETTNQAERLV